MCPIPGMYQWGQVELIMTPLITLIQGLFDPGGFFDIDCEAHRSELFGPLINEIRTIDMKFFFYVYARISQRVRLVGLHQH